ncbi:MAG: hypothetical protein WC096_08120 [Sphaerochaetaceae bacterium]
MFEISGKAISIIVSLNPDADIRVRANMVEEIWIWSNRPLQKPDGIEWCESLKLAHEGKFIYKEVRFKGA